MSGILDKIEEKTKGSARPSYGGDNGSGEKNEINMAWALIVSVMCMILAAGILISLVFAFSYDICLFLYEYIIYLAGVIGLLLAYSIYMSFKAMKKRTMVAMLNIIFSLAAIVLVIIPFLTGLLYLWG